MANRNRKIIFSLDPGFNGCKIVIDKQIYHFPFAIQDITEKEKAYRNSHGVYAFTRCIYGKKLYLFGDIAMVYMKNPKNMQDKGRETELFFSVERFETEIFEIAINTFIAYGLLLHAQSKENSFTLDQLAGSEISLGIALPHQYADELLPKVAPKFKGVRSMEILVDDEKYDITYNVANVTGSSQAVCALNKELTNDEGEEDENSFLYGKLPLVVIDAGYKTIGIFEIDETGQTLNDESNQEFAMKNVDDEVASRLNEFDPSLKGYMIEEYCRKDDVVRYLDKTEQVVKEISVNKIKDQVLSETANSLIEYLEKKFNHFLYDRALLVAGGTGSVFFPYIKERLEKKDPRLAKSTFLADSPFAGRPCDAIYAVAVGMYKFIEMDEE